MPGEITHNYRSSNGNLSPINLKRISRLLNILKTGEVNEQMGKIILKTEFLKKEQKWIENKIFNIFGKSWLTRFVRNLLKQNCW